MSVTVTLKIFPGQRNPVWQLNEEQIANLRNLFVVQEDTAHGSPRNLTKEKVEPELGYSGYHIFTFEEPSMPVEFKVQRGIVDLGPFGKNFDIGNIEQEIDWLNSSPSNLEEGQRASVAKLIERKPDPTIPDPVADTEKPLIDKLQTTVAPEFSCRSDWHDVSKNQHRFGK